MENSRVNPMSGCNKILCHGGNIEPRDTGRGAVLGESDQSSSSGNLALKKKVKVRTIGWRMVSSLIITGAQEIGNLT